MERGTILVVDDEPNIADLVELYLRRDGFRVVKVATGEDAVAAVTTHRPRLVVLDVGLPDIDGLDVYREIAKRWPGLPVLFSTGHGDETMLQPVLSAHVAYIQKPYEMQALMDALDKVIQK